VLSALGSLLREEGGMGGTHRSPRKHAVVCGDAGPWKARSALELNHPLRKETVGNKEMLMCATMSQRLIVASDAVPVFCAPQKAIHPPADESNATNGEALLTTEEETEENRDSKPGAERSK